MESILFLENIIDCLCLKFLVHHAKWKARSLGDHTCFPSKGNHIFFQFPFWCNLTYVPRFIKKELVYHYCFISKGGSHPVLDMDSFIIPFLSLSQLALMRIELKTSFIENCDHSIFHVNQFYLVCSMPKLGFLEVYPRARYIFI